jgi:predicted adenine nucleotide alpha hydrolase (AANH) superfamily ATPase
MDNPINGVGRIFTVQVDDTTRRFVQICKKEVLFKGELCQIIFITDKTAEHLSKEENKVLKK